jgi:hypothetical protein
MVIEIHNPEAEAMILNRMSADGGKDAETVILQALKASAPERPVESDSPESIRGKTLVELFDPIRGLMDGVDFSRNPSTARPLDL